MKNNKKVMTGALLLFMLLAANFQNASTITASAAMPS